MVKRRDQKITQAIIVAGGQGKRLFPLTATTPKPLIAVNGKPFICYLIDDLIAGGGKKRFILTATHHQKFDILEEFYPSDLSEVKIHTRITPIEFETGLRVIDIADEISGDFIFLYGDNFWPFSLPLLDKHRLQHSFDAQIVCYNNNDFYSTSNIKLGADRVVRSYSTQRGLMDYMHVDLGFGIFKSGHLSLLDKNKNESFERQVYPGLITEQKLGAFISDQRYYTLTNMRRYPDLHQIITNGHSVFINALAFGQIDLPISTENFKMVLSALKTGARRSGIKFKSNKKILFLEMPRLDIGVIDQPQVDQFVCRIFNCFKEHAIKLDAFYFCAETGVSQPSAPAGLRLMIIQAQKDLRLNLHEAYIFQKTNKMTRVANLLYI